MKRLAILFLSLLFVGCATPNVVCKNATVASISTAGQPTEEDQLLFEEWWRVQESKIEESFRRQIPDVTFYTEEIAVVIKDEVGVIKLIMESKANQETVVALIMTTKIDPKVGWQIAATLMKATKSPPQAGDNG